uniref:RRM domain-containing protein n=2 Tax=Wuchereria bancrofti TaxID=6293 RepID=A0A1I8EAD3_WUCBA
MDDWSIDGQKDVLGGKSRTLDEMMDSLARESDAFCATKFLEKDISQGMQIVSCTLAGLLGQRKKEQKSIRKTMLRTKLRNGKELSNAVFLKKVTFDVERFAADECDDAKERSEARARLAMKLGARPPKNNYFNYKQLKEELNVKKNLEVGFDKLSALKALKKLAVKKKMKKRNNMWKESSKSSESKSNGDKASDERKSGDVVERSDEDSRSRSPSEASRSRSRDRRQSSSCSRSRSKSRLRSSRRSRSPRYRRSSYDDRRYTFSRRDEPEPSRCLGVFGLSLYTTERDLKVCVFRKFFIRYKEQKIVFITQPHLLKKNKHSRFLKEKRTNSDVFLQTLFTNTNELFSQYGDLDNVQLVFDHPTGRSRGFGFVYFKKIEDAIEAKERVAGTEIDGHKIRIDYSITKRPHTPTPGIYMGAVDSRRRGPPRSYRRSPSPYRSYRRYRDSPPNRYYSRGYDYDDYDRYSPPYRDRYRRSPSPRYFDDRHRRRSRSYDRDRDYY